MAFLWVGVQFISEKFGPLECLAVLMLTICDEVRVLGSCNFTLQRFLIMSLTGLSTSAESSGQVFSLKILSLF